MTDVEALLAHRDKIIAMKTAILGYGHILHASQLDPDIKAIDRLLEKALTPAQKEPGNE